MDRMFVPATVPDISPAASVVKLPSATLQSVDKLTGAAKARAHDAKARAHDMAAKAKSQGMAARVKSQDIAAKAKATSQKVVQ